ncbi:Glucan endo-1,3-beta-glucosidase, partial [Lachnellula arida]
PKSLILKPSQAQTFRNMTGSTLNIALENASSSSTVYAYITGQAIDNNNALVLIEADGKTPYYPSSPSSTGQALAQNCAIPLGAPGSTVTVTVPRISASRIWFVFDDTLTFLLNPGPGLVEPSISNTADPNYNKNWGFAEFTFNADQLYANISYVDFVSIPLSMTLLNSAGNTQHVSGIPQDGLTTISNALIAQNQSDSAGWDQLIISNNGTTCAPVWTKYTSTPLSIDTQASFGVVQGTVSGDTLTFGTVGSFTKPSTADIFSNSSGPFTTGTAGMQGLTPRLAAGFNRSTLLIDTTQPSTDVSAFYTNSPTNHYARIVHATNLDNRGYAFPYDDVQATGGADQSGAVSDGNPSLLTFAVGGIGAST